MQGFVDACTSSVTSQKEESGGNMWQKAYTDMDSHSSHSTDKMKVSFTAQEWHYTVFEQNNIRDALVQMCYMYFRLVSIC